MSQDRMTTLFFELFSGLPRQGPGDTASTLRALAAVPDHYARQPCAGYWLRHRTSDTGSRQALIGSIRGGRQSSAVHR